MLTYYRKEQRKIAMGLLSFHKKMTEYQSLLKEIDMYENDEHLHLFLWTPDDEQNIQGIIGIERTTIDELIVHDISITPSFRGENLGFELLKEVASMYPETKIYGTKATSAYLSKWKEHNE
ncbi:GNAT family N-acetyltransferase [Enterococcus termitis]|jgi:riboflavin biosynthesis RibT protein|uniref:Protein RibT n=1 Tax=Enterococcus termitis TaxID=332950 RepID=A0A1E5G6Q8_9ENTE|nr:GNAT family N-acetyltransferase [Enterococcus termitis]OEG08378.1 protein RibT [Enterococcus termitis]OJG97998.1 hypothetical protein RV18_GL003694 [Enterococcus termitis]